MGRRFSGSRQPESGRAARSRSRTARRSAPAVGRVQWKAAKSICVREMFGTHALRRLRALQPLRARGSDECGEQRVRFERLGLEFRMELAAQEPGMIRN